MSEISDFLRVVDTHCERILAKCSPRLNHAMSQTNVQRALDSGLIRSIAKPVASFNHIDKARVYVKPNYDSKTIRAAEEIMSFAGKHPYGYAPRICAKHGAHRGTVANMLTNLRVQAKRAAQPSK